MSVKTFNVFSLLKTMMVTTHFERKPWMRLAQKRPQWSLNEETYNQQLLQLQLVADDDDNEI